jgi:hypothetical protein
MTDDDAPATSPDHHVNFGAPAALRGGAESGASKAADTHPSQLTLQFGRLGAQFPVTSFVLSLVTGVRQPLHGAHRGVRSSAAPSPLSVL